MPALESVQAARAAGLHYADDTKPGIRRRRAGKGWTYVAADGEPVKDAETLARIRSLAIPPAYTDVWINPDPVGHIQATGRDARGRKQYRYHPHWREVRDETKFGRMIAFGEALPALRARLAKDLAHHGMPREKVLATIVRLLDTTLIRVGNEEYVRENESYGLTTLRDEHAEIDGSTVHFTFRGKSGKTHRIDVKDRQLARIVRRSQDLPGEALFAYLDDKGQTHAIDSGHVNAYLRDVSGEEFTAKDFRTWHGTVLAAWHLARFGPAPTASAGKAAIVRAVDAVAERLGNTRVVARASYIHPAVLEGYLDGSLVPALRSGGAVDGLEPEEAAVLAYLTERTAATAAPARAKRAA